MAAGQTVRLDYVRHGLMEPRREEKEHRIASAVHLPVPVCSPHPYRSLSFPAEGHTTLVIAAPPLHRWRCPRSLEGGTRKGGRTAGHPCGSPWRNPRGMKNIPESCCRCLVVVSAYPSNLGLQCRVAVCWREERRRNLKPNLCMGTSAGDIKMRTRNASIYRRTLISDFFSYRQCVVYNTPVQHTGSVLLPCCCYKANSSHRNCPAELTTLLLCTPRLGISRSGGGTILCSCVSSISN